MDLRLSTRAPEDLSFHLSCLAINTFIYLYPTILEGRIETLKNICLLVYWKVTLLNLTESMYVNLHKSLS